MSRGRSGPPQPPSPPRGPGDEPRWLPGPDLTDAQRARLPAKLPPPTLVSPPATVQELADLGLISDGLDDLTASELRTAQLLTGTLRSVVVPLRPEEIRRTPDLVLEIGSSSVTVELKALRRPTASAVRQNLRRGRRQSRRVVIDGRDVGLNERTALAGLSSGLSLFGGDLDELLIVGRDFRIRWP